MSYVFLLSFFQNAEFIPNVEIFGTLIHRAGQDWDYKIQLCKIMSSLQIRPNKLLLKHIETHRQRAYRAIIDQVKEVLNLLFEDIFHKICETGEIVLKFLNLHLT